MAVDIFGRTKKSQQSFRALLVLLAHLSYWQICPLGRFFSLTTPKKSLFSQTLINIDNILAKKHAYRRLENKKSQQKSPE